jgi:hypothetical protein
MTAMMDDRVGATLQMLTEAAREMTSTGDGRIGEADAAALLGCEPETLAKKRMEGKGPTSYRLSVAASRVSYRLQDLALWIESSRDGDFE